MTANEMITEVKERLINRLMEMEKRGPDADVHDLFLAANEDLVQVVRLAYRLDAEVLRQEQRADLG